MRTSPLFGAIRWSVPPSVSQRRLSAPGLLGHTSSPALLFNSAPHVPFILSLQVQTFYAAAGPLGPSVGRFLWRPSCSAKSRYLSPPSRPSSFSAPLLPLCAVAPVPAAAPNEVGSRRGRWLFNSVRPPRGIQDSGATTPNTRWGPDYQPISFPPPNAPPSARASSLGGPGRPTPSPSPGSSMQGPAPCHLLSRGPMTLCSMS